jgi:hypothetical protein
MVAESRLLKDESQDADLMTGERVWKDGLPMACSVWLAD